MGTHNICFLWRSKKHIFLTPPLIWSYLYTSVSYLVIEVPLIAFRSFCLNTSSGNFDSLGPVFLKQTDLSLHCKSKGHNIAYCWLVGLGFTGPVNTI